MTDTPVTPPPPPPAPAAPAAPAAACEKGCPCTPYMPYAVLGGAFLLFVAFFLPWWSMSLNESPEKLSGEKDMKAAFEAAAKLGTVMNDRREWYQSHFDRRDRSDRDKGISLFGWNTATGITAFIFTFFVAAFVLGPMFVPVIRPYAWIGYLVSAIMYFIIFLLSTIGWLMCSPGTDVPPMMSQGISIGVWFAMIGSAVVTAAGAMLGAKGLINVIKGIQHKPA